MMKRYLILVLLSVTGYISNLQAQIKILESSPKILRIKWEIESIDTHTISNSSTNAVVLSFKGQNTVIGEDGEVVLPGYSIFAGIPPEGDIDVSIVPEKLETIVLSAKPIIQKSSNRDGKSQPNIAFSKLWLSDPVYRRMKNIRSVNLIVKPVVYDHKSNTVRVMTSGIITITLPDYPASSYSNTRSDFDRMIESLICNYDMAKRWRFDDRLRKATATPYPIINENNVYHFKIGDGHNGLNEGTINENGLMKITGSEILKRFGQSAISQVRLFASHKGEMPHLVPSPKTIPLGVIEVPLLRVDKNHNGLVDSVDFFIAYVTGATDWVFNSEKYEISIDRYDDYRHYWLTIEGRGASVLSHTFEGVSNDTIDVFKERLFLKRSIEPEHGSEGSLRWIWNKLSNVNPSFSLQLTLPGLVSTLSGDIQFAFNTESASLSVSLGDSIWNNCGSKFSYKIDRWGDDKVKFSFSGKADAFIELENILVGYYRGLNLQNDNSLTVLSSEDKGIFTYSLKGADSEDVFIFRIANYERNISLIEKVRIDSGDVFNWSDSGANGARYLIYKESALLSLPAHEQYQNAATVSHSVHELRNTSNKAGYLIITHKDFIAEAEELAVHKEKMGFIRPAVVDVTDIYRLFGGGDIDPVAIRNFISYVSAYWTGGNDLDYVVLMGSAHYDFKQFKAAYPVYVPTFYHNGETLQDDFFGNVLQVDSLTSQASATLCVGRIPCETINEAKAVVNKIKEFEDPGLADFGEWRNRALFVADDDMQGNKEDPISSMNAHHKSSDRASDILSEKWKSLDLRKIFLFEYEWDNSGEKPGASRAIINEINNGVGYVNYFGHGAYNIWSDEHILIPAHIQQMVNRGRYPLVSSFSCSVGKFDQPGSVCLSAALVKADRVGAIATISSSRASYAYSNEVLASNFYSQIADSLCETTQSIGMMLTKAKLEASNVDNNRTYVLLGDPSIKFVKSVKKINLEIVDQNDKTIDKDSLKALQMVKIKGQLQDGNGNIDSHYGASEKAFISIGLFNPPDSTTRKDAGKNLEKYILPGTPIFQGKTSVTNGHFEQVILIPKNVAFNKDGVKLIAYSWKDGIGDIGTGYDTTCKFNGSVNIETGDTTGPSITIRPVYDSKNMSTASASFSDRITSMLPLKCELDLYDQSGIDIVGVGPDEGLTMEIQGHLSKRNINHKFQFKEGDFRRGIATLEFDEKSLKNGTYTLTVTARDLLGYLTIKTFAIEIVDEQDLKLDNVFNFPNPFSIGHTTRFYFYPSNTVQQWTSDHIRVIVKIYTLSGKLVRVIKDAPNGVVWDGKDQHGTTLSPDVYLYQVHAYSSQKKKLVKSKVCKLVIHPPR